MINELESKSRSGIHSMSMFGTATYRFCLCGGGAQTHVIGAWLSSQNYEVSILTRKPFRWNKNYIVKTSDGPIEASIQTISDNPSLVIPNADIILLTVPGDANREELEKIKPYVKPGSYVGGCFCSSGFFFDALHLFESNIKLWGFQRVPFIARIEEYGQIAVLKSSRPQMKIAIEYATSEEKEQFRQIIQKCFKCETMLLNNYLEASITNSNPILHTARLYTMFSKLEQSNVFDHNILFYEEWTDEASNLLIQMDKELFSLLTFLPVAPNYLTPLLEYYESTDSKSLTKKISSIEGFKGITSPMKQLGDVWIPNFSSRYFTEDFGLGLFNIYKLAMEYGVDVPNIKKVLNWGLSVIKTSASNQK